MEHTLSYPVTLFPSYWYFSLRSSASSLFSAIISLLRNRRARTASLRLSMIADALSAKWFLALTNWVWKDNFIHLIKIVLFFVNTEMVLFKFEVFKLWLVSFSMVFIRAFCCLFMSFGVFLNGGSTRTLYETKKMARKWIKCGNRCYLLFDQYLFLVIFLYVAIFCYYTSVTGKPGVKRNFWLHAMCACTQ